MAKKATKSDWDNSAMTNQYLQQYNHLMANLVFDEAELIKAQHLLRDRFASNDAGARTAVKAYTKSIRDTKNDIRRNILNAQKAINRGEAKKYWRDADLKKHGISIPS